MTFDDLTCWILDGREVRQVDAVTWAEWFGAADRQIALTKIAPGIVVSTVFLGLDHGFGRTERPLLFETMTFDDYGQAGRGFGRWATYEDAEFGHAMAVEEVRGALGIDADSETAHPEG